jgi:surfactin synthase thioesterase subunit
LGCRPQAPDMSHLLLSKQFVTSNRMIGIDLERLIIRRLKPSNLRCMPTPHNHYLPTEIAPDAKLRLFALPYAGGGTAGYFRWRPAMRPAIDVLPISLPGRDARIGEPAITDMRTLVAELADAVGPLLDRPFAIVGHSMGGWLGFELARELRRRGALLPSMLIVAASPAPHRPRETTLLHKLPDAEFVAQMCRRFDGIPPAVRENEELLQLLLPALRADMQLLETYEYAAEPPLETDVLALGGSEDRAVTATALADWRRHTSQRFSSRLVPGGHFFLFPPAEPKGSQPAAVKLIAEKLAQYVDDSDR